MKEGTSRPEAAFVLLLLQAVAWSLAGLTALPFVLGGELYEAVLAGLSLALAAASVVLGAGIVQRRNGPRVAVIALEWCCLAGSLLVLALPLGANRGPVAVLVNVVLPASVILLLTGRAMRAHFRNKAGAPSVALG